MAVNIETVLTELGWGDGFRIPVANEENRRLEKEIEKKMKLKEDLNAKLLTTEEKIKMMKKHLNNLITEQDVNQKLLSTYSAQIQAEDHHYRLSCNTESNLRNEARNFQKEWREVNELVSGIEKELEKITKKIEISKNTLQYDEKGLREMEDLLNENEDNNQLIEQYMKEDLKEYKELELKRQKLSEDLQIHREAIVKTSNEAQEMEIVLNRTASLYDQALSEYRQMFNQWKASVTMLQQRNDDVNKIIQEIESLQEISQDKKKELEECEKFLKEQTENNKQMEEGIKKSEKNLAQMKEEQNKMKEMLNTYDNQLLVQRNITKELNQRLQQVRADIKHKEVQINIKYSNMEKLNNQVVELTAKLEHITNQKQDIEGKGKELEEMIEEQEKRKNKMSKEVNRLQQANLRATNQIKDLSDESKVLKMQCEKEQKKFEYLDKLYAKEEQILEEKKEVGYQVKYELQKSEMKLDRLRGNELDKSENERKQNKIEELQNILNEKTKVSQLLQKQIANLGDDMKKISTSLANDKNEVEYIQNKKQDLILHINAAEKQLKCAQNRYEEKQVEESMLRLRVSQMEKMFNNVGNNVYNLERYRLELEAAVRERKAEITVQKESLIIQKRVVEGECSDLRCAIAERKIRIKQLQSRHDNSLALLGTNPDGTPMSTLHLKIQSAQEKYLLQEQGDKLDEAIRKAEEEIQAMENTLRVINVCNDKYKVNLNPIEQNEVEAEEYKTLDERLREAEQNLKLKKEELQFLTENIQKLQNDYTEILKVIDETQENKENKNEYLANLKQQIQEQKEKLLRADKNMRIAKKNIIPNSSSADPTLLLQMEEVELRELQEQNIIALQDIAEFAVQHVEVETYIKKLLAAHNIELPLPINQLQGSSRSHSTSNSIKCPSKSTSHGSAHVSSKGNIGHIVNIEPAFETMSIGSSSKRSTKQQQLSAKTSIHAQLPKKSF